MESTLPAILLGGIISLISAFAGISLQHFLSMRKMVHESKIHPSRVLYDKQIAFLDVLTSLLDGINGFITTIDVFLGEEGEEAKAKVMEVMRNTACLVELDQLVQRYYMYLPSELLDKVKTLSEECWSLASYPDLDKTYHSINLLFEIQNSVREFVGVDRLSQDLMKALSRKTSTHPKESTNAENKQL